MCIVTFGGTDSVENEINENTIDMLSFTLYFHSNQQGRKDNKIGFDFALFYSLAATGAMLFKHGEPIE